MLVEVAEESLQFCLLEDGGSHLIEGDAFLLQCIAVANGDGVVFYGLEVDSDAIGGADGVLAAITTANGVFFFVVALGVELELIEEGMSYARKALIGAD